MNELTVTAIEKMHYSDLVGLVRERNRPSGGVRTVQTVAVNAFLGAGSRVLEVGSNTGFTSVNLALLCQGHVVGIDVEPLIIEILEDLLANDSALDLDIGKTRRDGDFGEQWENALEVRWRDGHRHDAVIDVRCRVERCSETLERECLRVR